MKIISYNVNGIRSAHSKGLYDYLQDQGAEIVCFQELKALPDQIDQASLENMGYHCHWFSAQKKGYSGVGIISKAKPKHVEYGCNHELFDFEGRVLRLDFDWGSVISAYFPSGTSGDDRQNVKFDFLDYFYSYIQTLKKEIPNLVVCGDYNICHHAIDIHDPVSNKNSTGFLPEEREWMTKWFEGGFTDAFRSLNPEPNNYTWWSFRANARANNKGWRIDYVSVSNEMSKTLISSGIDPNAKHSDHCPTWASLAIGD